MTFPTTGSLNTNTRKMKREDGGYRCPVCRGVTAVIDSRGSAVGGVRRRRECAACHTRFTTHESDSTNRINIVRYQAFIKAMDELKHQARLLMQDMGSPREDS